MKLQIHLNRKIGDHSFFRLIIRSYKTPLKDVKFLLKNVFDFPNHYKTVLNEKELSRETLDLILEECKNFSENVLYPLNQSGDKEGSVLTALNCIKTPRGYKEAYRQFVHEGWQGISFPINYGGQGLPLSMDFIKLEMIGTANFTWSMFPGLTSGCIHTILQYGDEYLKKTYLSRLISGEWTGTMCLSESNCGSDVSQIRTEAIHQPNGTYSIKGRKIFISCGEHDLTDNIVHCVLARIPTSPSGNKGLSLFLVPKYKISHNEKVFNRVNVYRIENKMGCHGSPTCEVQFEESEGYLLGNVNQGLSHMFTFINNSRIGVAIQGVGAAELSFQKSFHYSKQRCSMRSLTGVKAPHLVSDPLIVHPDIRRMLLTQKCYSEGGRAMIYQCAMIFDLLDLAIKSGNKKLEKQKTLKLGFLTPILKGFLTEKGIEAAQFGIQIWGGHGYIKENGVEQILRDVRVSTLWEGTTGIQALDLLARKVLFQKLKPLNNHVLEIYLFCFKIFLGSYKRILWKHSLTLLKETFRWHLASFRLFWKCQKDPNMIGSASFDYLIYSGYNVMGHVWLLMAETALKERDNPEREHSIDFYDSKVQTCDFYYSRLFPQAKVHYETMLQSSKAIMDMKEENFLV